MSSLKGPRQFSKSIFSEQLKKHGNQAPVFSLATGSTSRYPTPFRSLAWSPAGNYLATSKKSEISVWNPERAAVRDCVRVRGDTLTDTVEKVSFCPNTEAVLASTGDDGICRLYDVRRKAGVYQQGTGTRLGELKIGEKGVTLAWHPDGQELLIGRANHTIQHIDLRRFTSETGSWGMSAQSKVFDSKYGIINDFTFDNTGKQLFVTNDAGNVHILEWPSLREIRQLNAHQGSTHAVQVSMPGKFVAVGGDDSTVSLWDASTWRSPYQVKNLDFTVKNISFTGCGGYFSATAGPDIGREKIDRGIKVFHVESGEVVHTFETSSASTVTLAAWSPQHHWLAYLGDAQGLKIFGANKFEL